MEDISSNYERYMMRMEIGELNRAIQDMKAESKTAFRTFEENIDALNYELKQTANAITKLANAIRAAAEVKIVLNEEDEWYNDFE